MTDALIIGCGSLNDFTDDVGRSCFSYYCSSLFSSQFTSSVYSSSSVIEYRYARYILSILLSCSSSSFLLSSSFRPLTVGLGKVASLGGIVVLSFLISALPPLFLRLYRLTFSLITLSFMKSGPLRKQVSLWFSLQNLNNSLFVSPHDLHVSLYHLSLDC